MCRVLETSADGLWSAGMDELHPVLLLRDTEGWCPFCERWDMCSHAKISVDTKQRKGKEGGSGWAHDSHGEIEGHQAMRFAKGGMDYGL